MGVQHSCPNLLLIETNAMTQHIFNFVYNVMTQHFVQTHAYYDHD